MCLLGCGTENKRENQEERSIQVSPFGGSCSVSQNEEGALIECTDGSSAQILHGSDGINGIDGTDGAKGDPGTDGENGVDGTDGKDGAKGDVIQVNTPMVYEGYYCSRTVVSIGEDYYLVYSGMVKLSASWYKVSNTCSIRVKDDVINIK